MAGATPKLHELHLQIHEHGVEHYGPSTIDGVEHLRRLKQADVVIFFEGADTETQRRAADAKAILKKAISISPGHPSTKFSLEENKKYLNFPLAFLTGAKKPPSDAGTLLVKLLFTWILAVL